MAFKPQAPELLAPAGNMDILKKLVASDCGAFYFGGKNFNMRLHRAAFNFDPDEMTEAVKIIHGHGKKAYITVNNLNSNAEMKELPRYLDFIAQTGCDAVLVQDYGLLPEVLKLGVPVHASVMMNVHNGPTVKRLHELGVKRAVLSREIPLSEAKLLSREYGLELEYFVHGDMCVAHGGQCLYSGLLFGESSNRGRCLKPCRWGFLKDGTDEVHYPLAVKDMCMYEYIPELIDAGICCFKIEGRMRGADYLEPIINAYGSAVKRYMEDPAGFDRRKDFQKLYEHRNRDFSTAYAFGKPGEANINTRYEGTGAFYSTGKMFSQPTEEHYVPLSGKDNDRFHELDITVRVQNTAQAAAAIEKKVNRVVLSGEVFLPGKPFSKDEILELCKIKKDTEIIIGLPHMMKDLDFFAYGELMRDISHTADGLFCTNLGAAAYFRECKLYGDIPFNVYNSAAAGFLKSEGILDCVLSPELKKDELLDLLSDMKSRGEENCGVLLYGSPTVMYMDYDLWSGKPLTDSKGYKHPLFKDCNGRNHVLLNKPINLFPWLDELKSAGLRNGFIEAGLMTPEEILRL